MKKMIAFLMALCMLMAAFSAVAEEPRAVMQDELPPELIVVDGVAARILDASGNAVAEITDNGLLKLTDVHERTTEAMEDVRQRLVMAYEALMTDVHFSDVDSAIGLENLKEEINQALNTQKLTAYDVHMFEIFDVKLLDELAALLADGAVLEFTIKPEEMEVAPLLLAFSADGEEWHLLPDCTFNADKTITVRVPSNGTLGILLEYQAINFPGNAAADTLVTDPSAVTGVEEIYPNFTPSVSGKPAPMLITTADETGRIVVANIKFEDGKTIIPIYSNDGLVITPVSESAYTMDVTTHEHLQWSYDGILQAETVGHIRTGIGAEIDGMLQADGFAHLNHFDMIVRDLFEVTIYGDHVEMFYNDDAYLEVKFDALLAPNEPLIVIFSSDSHNWHVLHHEDVIINEDGTLTLKLEDMGTVAFLVEKADKLTHVTVNSPE